MKIKEGKYNILLMGSQALFYINKLQQIQNK